MRMRICNATSHCEPIKSGQCYVAVSRAELSWDVAVRFETRDYWNVIHEGYSYNPILAFLVAVFGICISIRTLKRSLRRQGLMRRNVDSDLQAVGRCLIVCWTSHRCRVNNEGVWRTVASLLLTHCTIQIHNKTEQCCACSNIGWCSLLPVAIIMQHELNRSGSLLGYRARLVKKYKLRVSRYNLTCSI